MVAAIVAGTCWIMGKVTGTPVRLSMQELPATANESSRHKTFIPPCGAVQKSFGTALPLELCKKTWSGRNMTTNVGPDQQKMICIAVNARNSKSTKADS
jgi:hypothetical protein